MQKIWAPWRNSYVTGDAKTDKCIFCEKPADTDDVKNLIIHRSTHSFVIMNLYPYNNGHIMVVPYRHVSQYNELSAAELADIASNSKLAISALQKVMAPQGFNIGYNLGAAAGAGIAAHIHQHIVPRYFGDTNFMPVLADCKIISEHIEITYNKLKDGIIELIELKS